MLRTGILLPRSTLFPSLGLDILNALKENLKKNNLNDQVALLTENIGFGTDEQDIYSKAEKMLLQDETDLVILCADTRITEMLQPLFTACNKILLAVNFGANFPDHWQPAPTTITHSLNFCFHARHTGLLAARETNKQAVNVVSFFDGGYRQCFCMLNSHQANGGVPRFNYVTPHLRDEFTLVPLADFLEKNPAINTLLCLFAGDMAEQFYREAAPLQKKYGLRLYVSPMMLEESLRNSLGEAFRIEQVKGFIPWHSSLNNTANNQFKETLRYSAGTASNYFSLLGWETGMILHEILRLKVSGASNAPAIVTSLTETVLESPRGQVKIDAATRHSYGPSYLAICKNNMDIIIDSEAENTDDEWIAFTKEKISPGENSSWRNTYLCI